jgi:hypothetical protein
MSQIILIGVDRINAMGNEKHGSGILLFDTDLG